MNLEEVLEEYGLSERQARVYLAALEMGESNVSDIAQKAQVRRSGTYYLSESLVKNGLFYRTKKTNKLFYSAVPPKTLLEQAKNKKQIIEEHFAEFQALAKLSVTKPSVRIYEGIDGIKQLYKKTLEKKNVELVGFCSYAAAEKAALYYGREYIDWGLNYIKERARKKVFARFIADDSPQGRERQALDKEEYRETRLIPTEKLPFSVEVDIYEDWVILMNIKDLMGLVIESKEIAAVLRTAFELAWEAAGKYRSSK